MHFEKFSVGEVGPIAFRNVTGPTLEYTFESFFDAFGDIELFFDAFGDRT